jgi:hypothetical protein
VSKFEQVENGMVFTVKYGRCDSCKIRVMVGHSEYVCPKCGKSLEPLKEFHYENNGHT